jgi:HK97 family phage prohead protease
VTVTNVLDRRSAGGTVEFRAADDGSGPVLEGYAAVFDRWSVDLGGFKEKIDRAAFNKTVAEADVVALWEHDTRYLLGRMASGTLRLKVDDRGLQYVIDPLPDTTVGRDVAELGRRKDIQGSSFGFRTIRDEWHEDDEGNVTRTLLEVALIDVSPVTMPAYPDTDAAIRSIVAQFHADPVEVRSALETRSLGRIIRPAPPEGAGDDTERQEAEQATEDDDERRQSATPVERQRLLSLYA